MPDVGIRATITGFDEGRLSLLAYQDGLKKLEAEAFKLQGALGDAVSASDFSGAQAGASQLLQLNTQIKDLQVNIARMTPDMRGLSAQQREANVAAGLMADGMEKAGAAGFHMGVGSAYARREVLILGREVMEGNFSRIPGTLITLAAHTGVFSAAWIAVAAPVLAASAAIGIVVYEMVAAKKEMDAMNNALAITGNFAGMTRGEMISLSESISKTGLMTVGTAKDIVTQITAVGRYSAENIGALARITESYAHILGETVDKVTPKIIKLFEDPTKAAEELNKQYHTLSVEELERIRTLQRTGQEQAAVTAAMKVIPDIMPEYLKNIGLMEYAWTRVTRALSTAQQAVKGTFSTLTPEEQIKKSGDEIEKIIARYKTLSTQSDPEKDPRVIAARETIRLAEIAQAADKEVAGIQKEITGEIDRQTKGQTEVHKTLQYQNKELKDRLVFAQGYETIDGRRSYNIKDETERTQTILKLRKEIAANDRSQDADSRAQREARINDELKLSEIHNKDVRGEIESQLKLGEISQETANQRKLDAQLELNYAQRLHTEKMLSISTLTPIEKTNLNLKLTQQQLEEESLKQAGARTALLQEHNHQLAMTDAYLKGQLPLWQAADKLQDDINKKVTDYNEFAVKTVQKAEEKLKVSQKELENVGKSRGEVEKQTALDAFDLETKKVTNELTDEALATAIAIRDVEREKLVALLNQNTAVEDQVVLKKKIDAEFKASAESIKRSLTDALMRGFESGKGFAQNFRDTLVNMFKTTILRPIISAVMAPVSGAIATALSGMGLSGTANAIGTAGGAGNLLSGASSLFSGGGTGSGMIGSVVGGFDSLFQQAGVSMGSQWIADIGNYGFGLPFVSGLVMAATGNVAGGIGSTLGGIAGSYFGPIGTAVGSTLGGMIGSALGGGKPTVQGGGGARINPDGTISSGSGELHGGYNPAAVIGTVTQAIQSFGNTVTALGGTITKSFGLGIGQGGGGEFNVVADIAGRQLVDQAGLDSAGMQLAATRAILTGLQQAADFPEYIKRIFAAIDASTATGDQINAAIQFATALKGLREQLSETRAPAQIAADQIVNLDAALGASATTVDAWKTQFVAAIDAGVNPTTLAQWQALGVAIQTVSDIAAQAATQLHRDVITLYQDVVRTAEDALRQGYQTRRDELDQTRVKFEEFGRSLRAFRDNLMLGDLSPLNPRGRYDEAQRQFSSVSNRAQLGDPRAIEQLQGVSESFLRASRDFNASGTQYNIDFAAAQGAVESTISVADRQVGIAQSQLAALDTQIGHLISLNQTALSIEQLVANLVAAQTGAATLGGTLGTLTGTMAHDQWMPTTSGGQIWSSPAGARAVMQPGQTTSESTIIGTSGKEFNALDTAKWIESARTSAEGRMQIYNEARREGMSLSSINPLMGWSANTAEDWARSMGLPTFATGGTASGWSMVGERGPELARFDAPARIYPAEQTRSMMSPASNDALLAKIDVLTQRVEQLTRVVADGDGANVAATDRVSQTHGDAAWRQEISQQRAA